MRKVVFQVSAMELKSRLDLTEIFCDVDDFYRSFEQYTLIKCKPEKPETPLPVTLYQCLYLYIKKAIT